MTPEPNFSGLNLDDVSVFNEIRYRLAHVTDAQIEAAGRRMKPKKESEKVIGEVKSPTTRGLYALWISLRTEGLMEMARREACTDAIEEVEHREKAVVLDLYEDVVGEMWWAQAKLDCDFREVANVGVRQGWLLIQEPSGGPPELRALLAGLVLPPNV